MIASLNTVERSFDRGACRYDELAVVQPQVASTLLAKVTSKVQAARSIVDLGCGTGRLLADCQSLNSHASLTGVDISQQMLASAEKAVPSAQFYRSDLAKTPLGSATQDVVLSTSAMQWVEPKAALSEAARVVNDDGLIAISSFLHGTLKTWRQAWGLEQKLMPLQSEFMDAANAAGLIVIELTSERIVQRCNSFESCLAGVRELGAGGDRVQPQGLLGRNKFTQAQHNVKQHIERHGVFPMEYDVLYLLAKKA